MRIRDISVVGALVFGLVLAGFDSSYFSILEILLLGIGSRMMLKNVPWIEFVTILTAFGGVTYGYWTGAYLGFFIILISDAIWSDFSNTIWNAPLFCLVGFLAGVLPLGFIILVAVLTLIYNILMNAIIVLVFGGSFIMSLSWTLVAVFVNMSVASLVGPKISSIII